LLWEGDGGVKFVDLEGNVDLDAVEVLYFEVEFFDFAHAREEDQDGEVFLTWDARVEEDRDEVHAEVDGAFVENWLAFVEDLFRFVVVVDVAEGVAELGEDLFEVVFFDEVAVAADG